MMDYKMQPDAFIPAVERTLQILELIVASQHGFTPQELLVLVDVPRSTLFQLLRTLKKLGYLEQSEKRGRYHVGPRLAQWSHFAAPSLGQDLITCFYNEANRCAFSETVLLISLSADRPFVHAQIESPHQVRSAYPLGQMESTPTFLAVLFTPPPTHEIVQHGVTAFNTSDTWECAAPICPDGVTPSALLVITAPLNRWNQESFSQTFSSDLRSMASRISYQLGAQSYFPYHPGEFSPIQVTSEMTLPEISAFLQGPWSARLACIRPDGRPHVVPVWQEWDGSHFTVLSWIGSYWAQYLTENPNVSLTIDEPWPPYHRVVVRGLAKKETLTTVPKTVVDRMSQRYMGSILPNLVQRIEGVFSITPEQLKGWKGIAGGKTP
jgi:DNA-binding IclR family transcriptional regulator